jgi:hypothetical protein
MRDAIARILLNSAALTGKGIDLDLVRGCFGAVGSASQIGVQQAMEKMFAGFSSDRETPS